MLMSKGAAFIPLNQSFEDNAGNGAAVSGYKSSCNLYFIIDGALTSCNIRIELIFPFTTPYAFIVLCCKSRVNYNILIICRFYRRDRFLRI